MLTDTYDLIFFSEACPYSSHWEAAWVSRILWGFPQLSTARGSEVDCSQEPAGHPRKPGSAQESGYHRILLSSKFEPAALQNRDPGHRGSRPCGNTEI